MNKKFRFFDYALIIVFLLSIFLPLLFTHSSDKSMIEKRQLATFPEWVWNTESIKTFPGKFQEWFSDHFGFRDYLAQSYYWLGVKAGSSSNDNVIIGKRQWLYYISPTDGNNLEDFRKNDPLSPEQLRQWKVVLETKYLWLKQQGVQFIFVIAPNKQSIYEEFFPSRIRVIGKQSRLDQFMEYMRESEVPILDLRQEMVKAKAEGQMYYKTDTHWNSFGAAVAQYAIMSHIANLFSDIIPVCYSAQDFSWDRGNGGDISSMLNLASVLKEENNPTLKHSNIECEKITIEGPGEIKPFITNCNTDAPSALIFRDSFFTALQPYISPYFSKSTFFWHSPDMSIIEQLVEQYKPNIIIEETVERHLKAPPALPNSTSKAYQIYIKNQFLSGQTVFQFDYHHPQELLPLHQVRIIPREHGYSVFSDGNDPHFEIPKFKIDSTKQYIIRVQLSTNQKTRLQIFYRTAQRNLYSEKYSQAGDLLLGENTFYAVLDKENVEGWMQIRVDPGDKEGEYYIKSIEVRTITM